MAFRHERSAVWQYPLRCGSAESDPKAYMQRNLLARIYNLEQPDIHFLEQTFQCLYRVILSIICQEI